MGTHSLVWWFVFALGRAALCQPPPELGEIAGVAKDAKTGQPLKGVEVRLICVAPPTQGERDRGDQTDGAGRFSFGKLDVGAYRLVLSSPAQEYQLLSKDVVIAGSRRVELVLEVEPWIEARWRLLSPRSAPVSGHKLRVTAVRLGQARPAVPPLWVETETDADARFAVAFAKTGTYRLWLLARDVGALRADVVVWGGAEQQRDRELKLAAVATVAGVAKYSQTGEGCPRATIRVSAPSPCDLGREVSVALSEDADAKGRFSLQLPEGTWLLSLGEHSSWLPTDPKRVVVRAGESRKRVVLEARRAARVSGELFGLDGQPVGETAVRAAFVDRAAELSRCRLAHVHGQPSLPLGQLGWPMSPQVSASTDAGGGFWAILPPVPASRLALRVGGVGVGLSDELKLSEGGELSVEVRLRPDAKVSGSVVDERDQPVPGAQVSASWTRGLAALIGETVAPATTEADGSFHLGGLLPGSYRLSGNGGGLQMDEEGEAVVEAGSETKEVMVRMRRPSGRFVPISGHVLLPDGRQAPVGSTVSAYRYSDHLEDGVPWRWGGAPLAVGGGATFTTRLRAGDKTPIRGFFLAQLVGFGIGMSEDLALGSQAPPDEVTVKLSTAASVDGQAVASDGEPVAGAVVGAVHTRWPVRLFRPGTGYPSCREAVTDAQGKFRLTDLAPAPYRLVLCGDNGMIVTVTDPVTPKPGQVLTGVILKRPQLVGAIRGRIVRAADDWPAPRPSVHFHGPHDDHGIPMPNCTDGRYELTGLPLGSYRVHAYAEDLSGRSVSGIRLTEGKPEAVVDFRLSPGGGLKGVVVDGDGNPALEARVAARYLDGADKHDTDDSFACLCCRTASTSSRGRFSLARLAPGEHSVRITHPEFASLTQEVTIREGEVTEVKVELAPAARRDR
jgi:hypothetical protein